MSHTELDSGTDLGWRRLLVEHRRPPSIATRPNAYWLALATVCIGAFMNQLDASIVTVAFPTLQHSFHASLGAVAWVGLSYLLVLVGLVTGVGRMADMVGRKLLYMYGFVVFIVASALCGLAPSLAALDGFRVLQGVGAAMIQANSVAIIVLALPSEKLGRGIGIQGAAQALGLALGPTIGGLLIALGGWRLIFFVNVPAGVIGTVMAWYLSPAAATSSPGCRSTGSGWPCSVPAVAAFLSRRLLRQLGRLDVSRDHRALPRRPGAGGQLSSTASAGPGPMLDLTLFKGPRLPPALPAACSPTWSCSAPCSWSPSTSSGPCTEPGPQRPPARRHAGRARPHGPLRRPAGRAARRPAAHRRRHGHLGGHDGHAHRRPRLAAASWSS